MRYLGKLSGTGLVRRNGVEIARASYDFDGYQQSSRGVTCSGEIRLAPAELEGIFGFRDVQLLTDEGRVLDLKFSGKKLPAGSDAAHVDVSGQLPTAGQSWRH
jgi:hypothetical protein